MSEKAKYWTVVAYLENMVDDWRDSISDILQVPYAYCVHDKDTDKEGAHRKDHAHIIIAFPNTTTYKHAFSVLSGLNRDNLQSFNKIERVVSIRFIYDYLIHDTDDCRKKGKYLYDISERITGNNFDIGNFEQLSITDEREIKMSIARLVREKEFYNYLDLHDYIMDNYDSAYFDIVQKHHGYFEALTRGFYLRWKMGIDSGRSGVRSFEVNSVKKNN